MGGEQTGNLQPYETGNYCGLVKIFPLLAEKQKLDSQNKPSAQESQTEMQTNIPKLLRLVFKKVKIASNFFYINCIKFLFTFFFR